MSDQRTGDAFTWLGNRALRFLFLKWWYVTLPVLCIGLMVLGVGIPWQVTALVLGGSLVMAWFQARSRQASYQEDLAVCGSDWSALEVKEEVQKQWTEAVWACGLVGRKSPALGVGTLSAYLKVARRGTENMDALADGDPEDYHWPEILEWSSCYLGIEARIRQAHGQTVEDWEEASTALATSFQAKEIRVFAGDPGTVRLVIVLHDPLQESRVLEAGYRFDSTTERAEIGVWEDGSSLLFRLDQNNSVVGGVPGSGKSVSLQVLGCSVARLPQIQTVGIDLKGGVEFGDWNARWAAISSDQTSAVEILEQVDEIGQARMRSLAGTGYRSMSQKGYTVDEPMILVMIDECSELWEVEGPDKEDKERAARGKRLVSKGIRLWRAAGIFYILATQKPTTDVLPSIMRDNCSQRMAHNCTTAEQAVAILGEQARSASVLPTALNASQRGYLVSAVEGADDFQKGRSFRVDPDVVSTVVRQTSHLRRPLADLRAVATASEADVSTLIDELLD